jgi:hypothetical protein
MAASMGCLCSLAFLATAGIVMLFLACALPEYKCDLGALLLLRGGLTVVFDVVCLLWCLPPHSVLCA